MKYILSVTAVFCAVIILCNPSASASAVGTAVNSCLEVIIPSLFAFTVLAVYLQQSGLYRIALRPLTIPLSKILQIDEDLCAVFLLGNIGGYPVGAKLLYTLVSEGRLSDKDASRLMCCCYGSGPSFVISIAGISVFGSAAAGGILFAACFVSSFIVAVFVCRCGERIQLSPRAARYDLSSGCFIGSVMSAARVMFTVCAAIVGFSAVTAVLDISGVSGGISHLLESLGTGSSADKLFPAFLEISRLRELKYTELWIAPVSAALLSFGGLCVVMQIAALTSGKIPLKGFLISRIPAAILSGIGSFAILLLPDTAIQVSAPAPQLFSGNAGMSLCLMFMCGILLCTAQKNTAHLPQKR